MKHIELQRVAPADIEARSMELIGRELGERVFPAEQLPVVKRVIHTTADFEYADSLLFSAGAVEAGVAAIRQGCTIVTDTQMAFSGVNKRVLEKFGGRAVCFMSDPDVAAEAKARGETRATAVSYTHLDVYKRQRPGTAPPRWPAPRRRPGHGPSLPGWRTGRSWTRRRCWRPTRT